MLEVLELLYALFGKNLIVMLNYEGIILKFLIGAVAFKLLF
jgi:hypothetical protein